MSKPSIHIRANALDQLANACNDINPAAAAILRDTAKNLGAGAVILPGALAVRLRDAGLDAVSASAACRLCR